MTKTKKMILDACCGSKMFWFDKNNPDTLFMDIRSGIFESSNEKENVIEPDVDVQASFTQMPFEDESFKMVVLDPPHRGDLGKDSWMANQYGQLLPTWETDLKAGFDESMRVLEPGGFLIFKWNEKQVKVKRLLEIFNQQPLFGHRYGKSGRTHWLCFMKK